jgi:hypothetical protein
MRKVVKTKDKDVPEEVALTKNFLLKNSWGIS